MRGRYWRLLSTSPAAAKRVVLSARPVMEPVYEEYMDDDLLYLMLEELGTVASVYYKPPEEFVTPKRGPPPVSTNSPLPDEDELGKENEEDSDDSELDVDIFADSDFSFCWNKFIRFLPFFVLDHYFSFENGKASSRFNYVQKTSWHR